MTYCCEKMLCEDFTILNIVYWGWVAHISVSKLTIIGSDNGLSPSRCQAIILTNDGILLIGTRRTNLNQNSHIFIQEMHWKMPSGKWGPFCLGLNVFRYDIFCYTYMPWMMSGVSQNTYWYLVKYRWRITSFYKTGLLLERLHDLANYIKLFTNTAEMLISTVTVNSAISKTGYRLSCGQKCRRNNIVLQIKKKICKKC